MRTSSIYFFFASLLAISCHLTPSLGFGLHRVRWSVHRAPMRMSTPTPPGDSTSTIARCRQKIAEALEIPLDMCAIQSGDDDPNGTHIYVECVSEKFEGKRSMQRQQMIFKALWDEMKDGGTVHAVDGMVLKTPKELEIERAE